MKLAKKNDKAALSFEMLGVSRSGRKVRVAHDVRIDVMRPSEVDKLREPLCPEPDVCSLNFRIETRKMKGHGLGHHFIAPVAEDAHDCRETPPPLRCVGPQGQQQRETPNRDQY